MKLIPESVEAVIAELGRLPGIGPRTAERLTFHLLRSDAQVAERLGLAVGGLRDGVSTCQICFNLADSDTCVICRSDKRHTNLIAVVEEPLDVVAVEKTGQYHGLYHVLGGALSPIDGIGPSQLQIDSLIKRVEDGGVEEIIIATNPSTEGEATALYLRRQLESYPVSVTRLARGLPVGGDLEYADQVTLGRAMVGRQTF